MTAAVAHVVQVHLQGFIASADEDVGKHEFAEQEREGQQQRHHQALAQVRQHHQERGLESAGAEQLGGVHQVAQVDGLQVVGDRPVHERQGDGEVATDQDPRRADHRQRPGAVELQQPHRRHHRRHREGQQDEDVHQRVESGEVVMHHEQQRQDQHHREHQRTDADQQRLAEGVEKTRIAPQLHIPFEREAAGQHGGRPTAGDGVDERAGQGQQQDGEQQVHHRPMIEPDGARFSARHGSSS